MLLLVDIAIYAVTILSTEVLQPHAWVDGIAEESPMTILIPTRRVACKVLGYLNPEEP
jgi:hypothetical protein